MFLFGGIYERNARLATLRNPAVVPCGPRSVTLDRATGHSVIEHDHDERTPAAAASRDPAGGAQRSPAGS